MVDVNDLVAILANWGLPGCTDLDGSGTTDAGDLAIVTGQLFEVVPSSGG